MKETTGMSGRSGCATRSRHWLFALGAFCSALAAAPQAAGAQSTVTLRPAAGPPGERVAVSGRGFGASNAVTVRVGRRTLARKRTGSRGSFDATFRVPKTARKKLEVVSRSGRRSVVSLYRVSNVSESRETSEVASSTGARLRWTPSQGSVGSTVGLQGIGFPTGRSLPVSFGGVRASIGTIGRGKFSANLSVPPLPPTRQTITVGSGSTALAFDFRLTSGPSPRVSPVALPQPSRPAAPAPPDPPPPPTPTPQPAFPIRAAFYYAWFPEAWNQQGINPFTKYHPTLGFYASNDQAVRLSHLRSLEYAKFEAGIYSWWGQGHYTDQRFPAMLAGTNATNSPVKWAVYHEAEGYSDPTAAQIASDLDYIKSNYAADPSYLRVGGKPVVFAYARGADACPMADRWIEANTPERDFYLVLKVFPGYRSCTSQPQSWHQYAPSTRADRQSGYSFAISPEFDLTGPEPERLPRDLAAFEQAAVNMVASNEPWQLVISFNEWGENTATEQAAEWPSASGHGQYLDVLAGL